MCAWRVKRSPPGGRFLFHQGVNKGRTLASGYFFRNFRRKSRRFRKNYKKAFNINRCGKFRKVSPEKTRIPLINHQLNSSEKSYPYGVWVGPENRPPYLPG